MLEVRPLIPSDEEIRLCIDVSQQSWPDQPPTTVENWRFQDWEWRSGKFRHRFVVTLDSQIIGSGIVLEPYWLDVTRKYQFNYDLIPAHDTLEIRGCPVHSLIEGYVLRQLNKFEVSHLLTSMREDREIRVAWLQEHQYYSTMRYPSAVLNVEGFDPSLFAGHVDRVKREGIAFHSLAYLQQFDPGWKARLYEVWTEIEHDVPSPDPPRVMPKDEFEKIFLHPSHSPELWVVAVDIKRIADDIPVGTYVGLTAVGPATTQPDHWYVWMTGVRRAYRRRGIATAIKLTSIALAQECKAKCFETGNEERNPMYGINMTLGFVPKPAWHDWERNLAESVQLSGQQFTN